MLYTERRNTEKPVRKGGRNILLTHILSVCSGCASVITLITLLVRPLRERLFGFREIREAQKATLRQQMLHIYYNNVNRGEIRQYEYENFLYAYQAYKAMKGNTFIDKIYQEVRTWEVKT